MPRQTDLKRAAQAVAGELKSRGLLSLPPSPPTVADAGRRLFDTNQLEILERAGVFAVACDHEAGHVEVLLEKRVLRSHIAALPQELDGIAIVYAQETLVSVNPTKLKPRQLHHAPRPDNVVRCGDSISPGNDRSAGTLGALVRSRVGGELFGLTCNHVTGGCNNMHPGMPVVSPGILDVSAGTQCLQMIGRHHAVLPLRQGPPGVLAGTPNFDAALFRIDDESRVSSSQRGEYDTPTRIKAPAVGMKLRKVGRTTEHSLGRIKNVLLEPISLDYAQKIPLRPDEVKSFQGVCTFDNAWAVHRATAAPFAAPGDSGSLVVEANEDVQPEFAVGLLYSVGRSSGTAFMLPLKPILDAFGVDLVGGHNI